MWIGQACCVLSLLPFKFNCSTVYPVVTLCWASTFSMVQLCFVRVDWYYYSIHFCLDHQVLYRLQAWEKWRVWFESETLLQVDIAIPEVFVGGLLGAMLIFVFSAWACAAVGRTAQEVVNEVRRQFIERPGIMVSLSL